MPNEIPDAIPFGEDRAHASYDPDAAQPLLARAPAGRPGVQAVPRALSRQVQPGALLLGQLRPRGDALLRAAGARRIRAACPNLPDWVAREAYSHEVSSAGFWPGGGAIAYPAFYSYAYPEPAGFAAAPVRPAAAFFSSELRRVHAAVRRRARRRIAGRAAAGFPAEHLRGRGRRRRMGSRRARVRTGGASAAELRVTPSRARARAPSRRRQSFRPKPPDLGCRCRGLHGNSTAAAPHEYDALR